VRIKLAKEKAEIENIEALGLNLFQNIEATKDLGIPKKQCRYLQNKLGIVLVRLKSGA
jgi:hypothetical protein